MNVQLNTSIKRTGPNKSYVVNGMVLQQASEDGYSTLELSNRLHLFLELDNLIDSFYRHTVKTLTYSGLIYQLPRGKGEGLSHGVMGGHCCSYELVINERPLGSVDFYNSQAMSETQMMEIENTLCALINPLQNALLYREAMENSFRDALTRTKNRAAFNLDFDKEIDMALRHERPLSLIVMDIDHFKRINDTLGHSYGDEVLCSIVEKTQETIRTCDTLYRYGGEEFTILASCTDLDGARILAERIRNAVYEPVTRGAGSLTISTSCGLAQLRPGETRDHLFKRADAALYAAKRNGRNQVSA